MDTKETVSKKEYDDLVEAYGECQARYQWELLESEGTSFRPSNTSKTMHEILIRRANIVMR